MGFTHVKVICQEDAFKLFRNAWIRAKTIDPDEIKINNSKEYIFSWDWIKWYIHFNDVKEIANTMTLLSTDPFTRKDGYAFKAVFLHEDNSIDKEENDLGQEYYEDFCVSIEVIEPDGFKTVTQNELNKILFKEKGDKTMNNTEKRMESLKAAGIDTTKFTLNLPKGLQPGASIQLVINENGEAVIAGSLEHTYGSKLVDDPVAAGIYNTGSINDPILYSRWIMAQYFEMLNWSNYCGDSGYDAYLRLRKGYNYQFKVLREELIRLAKLERKDPVKFKEKSVFFTKEVVVATCKDYMKKLKIYVDDLPVRSCKGVPYKRIKGCNVFVEDIDRKVYSDLYRYIRFIERSSNYELLSCAFNQFLRLMKRTAELDFDTPKCDEWRNAFKARGAYETLLNLVMYHNCVIYTGYGELRRENALAYIRQFLGVYKGYQYHALLKKVIADNNFNYDKRMMEVYKEKERRKGR